MTREEEIEANYFAAHLLVPTSMLRQELEKIGGKIDLSDDAQVKALADRFDVSIALMAVRLLEECGKASKIWL